MIKHFCRLNPRTNHLETFSFEIELSAFQDPVSFDDIHTIYEITVPSTSQKDQVKNYDIYEFKN